MYDRLTGPTAFILFLSAFFPPRDGLFALQAVTLMVAISALALYIIEPYDAVESGRTR